MGLALTFIGLLLGGLSTFGYVYLVELGCAMNTTGCNSSLVSLSLRLLVSPEGLVYLGIMAVSIGMIVGGNRLRRR